MRESRREARGGRPITEAPNPTAFPGNAPEQSNAPDFIGADSAAARANDPELPGTASATALAALSRIVGGSGAGGTGTGGERYVPPAVREAPSRVVLFLATLFRGLAERFDRNEEE